MDLNGDGKVGNKPQMNQQQHGNQQQMGQQLGQQQQYDQPQAPAYGQADPAAAAGGVHNFCKACGGKLLPETAFCGACGGKI
mmetsp:Transcript_8566/g.19828  ORF Transcript_8566/g.19828 Transcript_8566/m.19828 type:complete len:82 (-) Transcript_8566:17-262(-)